MCVSMGTCEITEFSGVVNELSVFNSIFDYLPVENNNEQQTKSKPVDIVFSPVPFFLQDVDNSSGQ